MNRIVWAIAAIGGLWIGSASAADRVPLGIMNATQAFDPISSAPVVNIMLDRAGGAAMAEFSAENVGRVVDLYIDDEIVSSPLVREPILGRSLQISGSYSVEEATALAVRLRNAEAIMSIAARE